MWFKAVIAVFIFLFFSVLVLSLKNQEKAAEKIGAALNEARQELETQKSAASNILTRYEEEKRRADASVDVWEEPSGGTTPQARQAGVLPDI